jgi:hypothetical protein
MIEINVKRHTTVNLEYCSQEALDSLGTLDTLIPERLKHELKYTEW